MKTTLNHVAHDPALSFVFPKDVKRILTHITTYKGAWLHLQAIKDNLGKQKRQRLTIKEFADWEGIDANLVMQRLSS
jgi:hypothetical protein